MATLIRTTATSLVSLLIGAALVSCSSASHRPTAQVPNCSQLLAAAVNHVRTAAGDINAIMQTLTENCSDEYEIAVDYAANSAKTEFRIESCDELLRYGMRSEAVALLEEDGTCTFDAKAPAAQSPGAQQPAAPPAAPEWPEGGLGWNAARDRVGTVQRVCGPLMSARETADGTFVNIGRDFPSPERFTFIFWDVYLQPIAPGATICGRGEIYLYNGVAQMEMFDPRDLEIWR